MRLSLPATGRLLREPRHVLALLRLLVFTGLVVLGLSELPRHPALFWSVTIVYGVTVLGYLPARNREFDSRRVRFVVFLFDAAAVSALIVLRGRDVQGLIMAYFTLVILSALLAGVGRPLLNAFVLALLYHFVTVRSFLPDEVFTYERLGQLAFFMVIAAFMGYVARESMNGRGHTTGEPAPPLRESAARLRTARERLGADERLRTLDMLSVGIAHELRGPLAAISASVREGPVLMEDLERRLQEGESADEMLAELRGIFEDVDHAAGKLRQVAVGLSELGCGGGGAAVDVVPAELVERARQMLGKSLPDGVRIEVACTATRGVRIRRERMLQVLLNLAANGIDAMERRGGTLRLTAEDEGADRVAFSVSDTGAGIPSEVVERMYDPFYTTKAPGRGTGLGLYVAREIVRAQAGALTCDSAPGKGTTFRIEVPGASLAEDVAA